MSCESLDASDVPMGGEEQLSTAVPAAPNTPAKAGNAAGEQAAPHDAVPGEEDDDDIHGWR